MKRAPFTWLVVRAMYEMVRYDVVHGAFGVSCLERQNRPVRTRKAVGEALERAVCDAVVLASCFYWKPVLCLQRSICALRVLRSRGIAARVVVGYRPAPFFSHAWVEIDGRVVNDSAVYKKRLTVLHTI